MAFYCLPELFTGTGRFRELTSTTVLHFTMVVSTSSHYLVEIKCVFLVQVNWIAVYAGTMESNRNQPILYNFFKFISFHFVCIGDSVF